jgi:hypothetical protein
MRERESMMSKLFCVKLRGCVKVAFLGVAVLLLAMPMFSQVSNGRISGTVKDQTGGSISGAMVVVTDVARGIVRNLTTDDTGSYLAPNLIPGAYSVKVTYTGFQAWERTNIQLEVGAELSIDAVLLAGSQTQTVTITEDVPLVNTTNAVLGGNLSNDTIVDLPLNGRNYQNLLNLRPGTIVNPGGNERQSTNGLRGTDNVFLVEGLSNDEVYTGLSMLNAPVEAGDVGVILPVDSIQEIGNSSNPKAENGMKPGGVVNIGIKSGTNSIHGSGFAFGLDSGMSAKNYFSNSGYGGCTNPSATGQCPVLPLAMQQWGATIGGPIKKDKIFFFGAFEEQRYDVVAPQPSQTPIVCGGGTAGCGLTTANPANSFSDALNKVMSPVAACPAGTPTYNPGQPAYVQGVCGGLGITTLGAGGIAPNSLLIAGCPAAPVVPTAAVGNSCTGGLWATNTTSSIAFQPNLLQNNQVDNGVGKISYNMNDKNSFSGVFFKGYDNALYNDSAGQSRPQWESLTTVGSTLVEGSWTYTPNSNWVSAAHVGLAHYYQTFASGDIGIPVTNYVSPSDGKNYSINTGVVPNPAFAISGYPANTFSGFPAITISGFGLGLDGNNWPKYIGPDNNLQFSDHLSYLRGNHAIGFGAELNRLSFSGAAAAQARGAIPFGASSTNGAAITDYFQGVESTAGASILAGQPFRNFYNWQTGLFFQDDWRVKPRLTVNLGLRYEYATVLKEQTGPFVLETNFIPNVGPVQVGSPGLNEPYAPDKKNFSPRFGFAYDIQGNGKTVLRGGISLIYEQINYISLIGPGNGIGIGTGCTGCAIQIATNGQTGGVTNIVPGSGNIAVLSNTGLTQAQLNWNGSNCGGTACATGVPQIFPATSLSTLTCGDGLAKGTIVNGAALTANDAGTCSNMNGVDPNLKTPYVTTWNLGVQRQITSRISLDIAYVGTHGTGLLGFVDQNQPGLAAGYTGNVAGNFASITGAKLTALQAVNPNATGANQAALTTLANCLNLTQAATNGNNLLPGSGGTCQPSSSSAVEQVNRPYTINCPAPIGIAAGGSTACLPEWRVNNMVSNIDISNYNGLQVGLTGRPTHGVSFNVAYTFSHALDMASSNFGLSTIPYNANARQLTYGPSGFDRRNVLNISTTYSVPDAKLSNKLAEGAVQGWSVNSILTLRGGTYWTPSSSDFTGNGDATGYWNFYGNPQDFNITHTIGSTDYHFFKPGNAAIAGADPSFAINNAACMSKAQSLVGPSVPMLNGVAVSNGTAGAVMTPTNGVPSLENLGCYDNNGSILLPPAYGSLPMNTRGIFEAPPFEVWDLSVLKSTKITERVSAQFRVEFFNVLNRPEFNTPGGNPTSTIFSGKTAPAQFGSPSQTIDVSGQSTVVGAGGPRKFQLGLKITF